MLDALACSLQRFHSLRQLRQGLSEQRYQGRGDAKELGAVVPEEVPRGQVRSAPAGSGVIGGQKRLRRPPEQKPPEPQPRRSRTRPSKQNRRLTHGK